MTASPVCSPSGWTKEYEIYGGVGFSGENAQIVASTAGRGSSNEGLGFNPARPSPAPTSFDDPISGLRVATSLAPRQLGRHHQNPFLSCEPSRKGCRWRWRAEVGRGWVVVVECGAPRGAVCWEWLSHRAPRGRAEGGPDTSPTQGAHTSS